MLRKRIFEIHSKLVYLSKYIAILFYFSQLIKIDSFKMLEKMKRDPIPLNKTHLNCLTREL